MNKGEQLSIHPVKLVAMQGHTEIELSLLELKHLAYLIAHRDRLVTHKELFEGIWTGRASVHTNIVNVYISYLRGKLGKETIITVRGEGFQLVA